MKKTLLILVCAVLSINTVVSSSIREIDQNYLATRRVHLRQEQQALQELQKRINELGVSADPEANAALDRRRKTIQDIETEIKGLEQRLATSSNPCVIL